MKRETSNLTANLPWLAGGGGLVVYLLTLNRWVSVHDLGTVARACGWSWQPEWHQPLTFLVLWPLGLMPERWVPPGLNLLAAVCAALVLALLARSVMLLPHDVRPERPFGPGTGPASAAAGLGNNPNFAAGLPAAGTGYGGRLTHHVWMPPVLAVLLCGLQLSFWEQATSGAAEMIDLLVFAYIIRGFLEFRTDQKDSWLWRCAVVYGAGMANNWVMVAYFPVFAAAVIWTKGFGAFLNARFLLRLALWGVAGLSLYLLLPVLDSLSSQAQVDFWPALKAHLKFQKEALSALRTPAFRMLALTAPLPFLVLAVRWRSHTVQLADESRLGIFITKASGHFVHAAFFAGAFWLALDPSFSPRHLNLGTPLLTYYYSFALVFGYCAGYFLLFGSGRVPRAYEGLAADSPGGRQQQVIRPVLIGMWVLLCAVPPALVWENLGQIRTTNGPDMREFARQLYTDLPAGKSVVLSDEPNQLLLLRAELSAHGHEKQALLLETPSLGSSQYRIYMAGKFKSRWPAAALTNELDAAGPVAVLRLVSRFAAQEPVVYLQPSFGILFERFRDEPKGLVHYLAWRRAAAEAVAQASRLPPGRPPLEPVSDGGPAGKAGETPAPLLDETIADGLVASNEQLWQQRWTGTLKDLAEQTKERTKNAPPAASPMLRALRLTKEPNPTASLLGAAYAKSLDHWGVELQRLGRWAQAAVWFQRALELNPGNAAAQINLEFNLRRQRGDETRLNAAVAQKQFGVLLAKYSDWREVLNHNGPVDEPTFLFRTGRLLLTGGNPRQAGNEFARCAELAPEWPAPKLWQAQSCIELRDFSRALELADRVQAAGPPQEGPPLSRLLACRANALRGLGRTNEAEACIEDFLTRYRQHGEVVSVAAELYAQSGRYEAELALLDELVKREPNRPDLLSMRGLAEMELERYEAAIATLTAALSLAPADDELRLRRAVAALGAGQLEAARTDYERLLKTSGNRQNALFGLGTIAWRKQDTNAAVEFYQQYLANSLPQTRQYVVAAERLKELKGVAKSE